MIRYALSLISLLVLLLPAYGESRTLWSIGSFDHSYREFAPGLKSHALYRIGKSTPAKDWPDSQDIGSSYNIQFSLTVPPRGTFLLKIGVQVYEPGIPALQLQVNGHEGTFYLHPKLSNDVDDAWATFDPHNSVDLLQIPIPASYLRAGENQIVISYVNQPSPNHEAARPSVVPAAPSPNLPANPFNPPAGYSSLHYDAISLENDPLHPYRSSEVQASVTPTIFYLEENGHLTELIDADFRFADAGPESTAKFTLNGQQYSVQIPPRKNFGEERVQIDVPLWTGPSNARIDLSSPHKLFRFPLTPAKKWTVFVVPHTHIDVGYTDFQGKVAEDQARSLDDTLKLIHDNPDFRFSPDGSWAVEQFLNTRSGDQQEQLLSLIRAGKIGFPAQYATLLTGYASLETLFRSLFYSKALSRQYGLPFNYANTTDVPTYTGAYPSILASSGIKYWVVGGDNGRGSILTVNPLNEQSPFWWEGPDGKRVLFFYSKCYEQVLFLFGLPPQQIGVYESLPIFLQAYSNPGYKPDIALIFGTQPENMTLFPETATFATEWNKHFAYPRLQYSTFPDFFHQLDSQYGDSFPVYKGDMGSFWEDGVASDAVATAQSRQNESGALTAEIASTVTHEINPSEHLPKTELDDAWKNIVLYAEHTWAAGETASRPDSEETTRQLAVKNNRPIQAAFQIQDISDRSMAQLADKIHIPSGTLVVFNPLSWRRDETVETDLTVDDQISDISTNTPVPYQVLSRKGDLLHMRFVARDLPSVGYKCFAIRSVAGSTPADPTLSPMRVVENDYYRVTLNAGTGSIQGIFDKQLSRELVDSGSPYHFGEYLYVTGGGDATQIIWPYLGMPASQLDVHSAAHGTYLGTERTPFGYSIHLRSSNLNTPSVDTEILLYNNRKQIDFRYDIEKQATTEREAAYVAFTVASSDPQYAYSSQMGWIDPAHNMFKGANVGWFSVHKWMAVHSKDFSVGIVPMDAPLATFGDINRGTWPTDFHPASSTLFSYIFNNYWLTNTPVRQGGHFQFRYTMTSGSTFSPESLTRLGVASMEPALLDHVVLQDKANNPSEPLPAEGASFLTIDNPAVMLVTWKMAEDGKGTVLRLQEIAGHRQDADVQFTAPISIRSAAACSTVEDPLETIPTDGSSLHLTLEPHEVKTVCLMP